MSVNEEELEKLSLEEDGRCLSIVLEEREEEDVDDPVDCHAANAGTLATKLQDNQLAIKVDEDGAPHDHNVQRQAAGVDGRPSYPSSNIVGRHGEKEEEEEIEARQSSTCSPASLGFTEDQFTFIDEQLDGGSCLLSQNLACDYRTLEGSDTIAETEPANDYPDTSEGRASELEGYNFLDESEKSETALRSDEVAIVASAGKSGQEEKGHERCSTACSPRSEGRAKARAPLPPTPTGDDTTTVASRQRSICFTPTSSCDANVRPLCPSAMVRYRQQHPHNIRFLQLSYNTNLKKPPDNWLRMKQRHHGYEGSSKHHFGASFWSYPFGKSSSWSMYSSFRYGSSKYGHNKRSPYGDRYGKGGRGSGGGHGGGGGGGHSRDLGGMHDFDLTKCQCCDCCVCSITLQTNCCCIYHCTHLTSSCRRPDPTRFIAMPNPSNSPNGRLPGGLPSILKKPRRLIERLRKRVAPVEPETQSTTVLGDQLEKAADSPVSVCDSHLNSNSNSQTKEAIKERGV